MSKSTPINQLPTGTNTNEQPDNIQSNNESELVSEILNEIESNRKQEMGNLETGNKDIHPSVHNSNDNITSNEKARQEQVMQDQVMQEQVMQEQVMQERAMQERAMQERALQEQLAMQDKLAMQPTMNMVDQDQIDVSNSIVLSKTEKIINELKVIGIVSTIFILYSIPQVNNIILGLLPSRLSAMNNITLLLLVVKGIMAGITYYGVNRCLN